MPCGDGTAVRARDSSHATSMEGRVVMTMEFREYTRCRRGWDTCATTTESKTGRLILQILVGGNLDGQQQAKQTKQTPASHVPSIFLIHQRGQPSFHDARCQETLFPATLSLIFTLLLISFFTLCLLLPVSRPLEVSDELHQRWIPIFQARRLPFSHYAYLFTSKPGPGTSDHSICLYTSSTMIRFSAYLISADLISSRKMDMALFSGRIWPTNAGGTNS